MVEVNRSGNRDIDGILWGHAWGSTSVWHHLTYAFPDSSGDYGGYAAINGFRAFTSQPDNLGHDQQWAVTQILGNISSFAHLSFSAGDDSNATLRFGRATTLDYGGDQPFLGGLHRPGQASDGHISAEGNAPDPYQINYYQWGDVWIDRKFSAAPTPGFITYETLEHEIGHTLGLKHGHDTQAVYHHDGTQQFPSLPANHNSIEFSVMTYNRYVGPRDGQGDPNFQLEGPQTYMQDDIAAIQYIYGANFNYNKGNTTYQWNADGDLVINGTAQGLASDGKILMTIWDGGGTDTYDFSNFASGMKIDLNPGAFSTFSPSQLANLSRDGNKDHFARGNIANALLYQGDTRSLIENAVGGNYADTIIGNQANNTLSGRGGSDNLVGGLGDDTLDGGTGFDTLTGGLGGDLYIQFDTTGDTYDKIVENPNEGFDIVWVRPGNEDITSYTMGANIEQGVIRGGDIDGFTLTGNELDNTMFDDIGSNTLAGGQGRDRLNGGDGDDVLVGGQGDDIYYLDDVIPSDGIRLTHYDAVVEDFDEGIDTVYVQAIDVPSEFAEGYVLGDNVENGTITGTFDFTLEGNEGENRLSGNTGANTIYGYGGRDVLSGGDGDDTLIGGQENDTYYLNDITPGDGVTITHYDAVVEEAGGGTDLVVVRAIDDPDNADGYVLAGYVENGTVTGSLDFELDGNRAGNILTGNDGFNLLVGGYGNDTLIGGLGGDALFGGSGIDTASYANSAHGLVVALYKATLNTGEAAGDTYLSVENITGSAFADQLAGNAGHNVIQGGEGSDVMTGGAASDTFTFHADFGKDTITDFHAGSQADHDRVRVDKSLFADFADLMNHTADSANGAVIGHDASNAITLTHVTKAHLVAADFSFA